MKKYLFLFGCVLFLYPFLLKAQKNTVTWKHVDEAIQNDLPQTVVRYSWTIFKQAEKKQNVPDMMKAIMTLTEAQLRISPDSLDSSLDYLRTWIKQEKNDVHRAVLQSLLGGLLIDNALSSPTVHARQLTEEGWGRVMASLQPFDSLKSVRAEAYLPLWKKGETDLRYGDRMLYPLLVHRALSLFDFAEDYLQMPKDSLLSVREDLCLRLGRFYGMTEKKELRALAKVEELRDTSDKLSSSDFIPLIAEFRDVETCAEFYYLQCAKLQEEERLQEAHDSLQVAIYRYPKYVRLNLLTELKKRMERPELSVRYDVFYPDRPTEIFVSSRNVSRFRIHVYRLQTSDLRFFRDSDYARRNWKSCAKEVDRVDYELSGYIPFVPSEHSLSLTIHEEGYYWLEAEALDLSDGMTQDAMGHLVSVSRIGLMELSSYYSLTPLRVVDLNSGAPIPSASIELYTNPDLAGGTYKWVDTISCDEEGVAVRVLESYPKILYARAVSGVHTFMPPCRLSSRDVRNTSTATTTADLFTDRALYRPGQTLHMAGVLHRDENDSLQVLVEKDIQIMLEDPNYKKVAEATVKTNEFGSFSAELVLPSSCLTGTFYLNALLDERNVGMKSISVEEYRRPQFEVSADQLTDSYCLGDTLWLTGSATYLTGAPVANAKVTFYGVPDSWLLGRSDNQAIREKSFYTQTTQTDEEGHYQLPFPTSLMTTSHLFYRNRCGYRIDVTSEGGDTESINGTLRVNESPCRLHIQSESADWLKEVTPKLEYVVTNANGYPLHRKVRATLYKVRTQPNGTPLGLGSKVFEREVEGETSSLVRQILSQSSGCYKLAIELIERGRLLSDTLSLRLASLNEGRVPEGYGDLLYVKQPTEEDASCIVYYGSSTPDAKLFVSTYAYTGYSDQWTKAPKDSILSFELPIHTYGGKAGFLFAYVKGGHLYQKRTVVFVPKPKKPILLHWRSFRDRLRAGDKEEWTLRMTDSQGNPLQGELLSTLYDASLDRLKSSQPWSLNLKRDRGISARRFFLNASGGRLYVNFPLKSSVISSLEYNSFEWPWMSKSGVYDFATPTMVVGRSGRRSSQITLASRMPAALMQKTSMAYQNSVTEDALDVKEQSADQVEPMEPASLRSNFAETAFFFPQLKANEQGEVVLSFTLPESLTTWHFRGLAHTPDLSFGTLDTTVIASKPFMLQARLPRFLRSNDRVSLDATVTNRTEKTMKVKVRMELFDPATEQIVYQSNSNLSVAAGTSVPVEFPYRVSDEAGLLACRMLAESSDYSDGEQHYLPILSQREWITESVSVSLRKSGTKEVSLKSLFNGQSATASQRRLTVEYTGKPDWLAVLALPSIQHPSERNAISLASAFYSAALSQWILKLHPEIGAQVAQWKSSDRSDEVMMSALQQDESLKETLLEATPFVADAEGESAQRKQLEALLDADKVEADCSSYLNYLKKLQRSDGGWSWFKGMSSNLYVTLSVTETLARTYYLTHDSWDSALLEMLYEGIRYLQVQIDKEYQSLKKQKGVPSVSEFACHYLYIKALIWGEQALDDRAADTYIYKVLCEREVPLTIYGKSRLATLHALVGKPSNGKMLLSSLLEYSVESEELGRYYDTRLATSGWRDYKIPTQSAAIEAFKLYDFQPEVSEAMQQWLLKQKQVQAWDTPVNTVDAVYALLLKRNDALQEMPMPELRLGDEVLDTTRTVPGLKLLKEVRTYVQGEKLPDTFTVSQSHEGLTWGAVYAQYSESLDALQQQGNGFTVRRTLQVQRMRNGLPVWEELKSNEPLKVGDRVKSVICVKSDRDMDFVQVRELRTGCLEPTQKESGYRRAEGGAYYLSLRDASSDYYYDRFSKGEHYLESVSYVTRAGEYSAGIVKVQCLYAPSFNAHTAGEQRLYVGK